MSSRSSILLLIFPIAALLPAVTASLAASGRLKRNGFLGIRLPTMLASETAWRLGHRAAAKPAWTGFTATTVLATISWESKGSEATIQVRTILFIIILVTTVVWSFLAARGTYRTNQRV